MEFKVEMDMKELKRMTKAAQEFGPKVVERANRDAIKKGKTTLSREVRERYNMPKKDFESFVRTRDTQIDVISRLLTVGTTTHFSITPKNYTSQRGIKVSRRKKSNATIKKGNKKYIKHAFIANPDKVHNTMLWLRKGDTIQPFKALSAAQMASNREVSKAVMNVMAETQIKRLEHHLDREIEKHANH